jgi:hypothetical protein
MKEAKQPDLLIPRMTMPQRQHLQWLLEHPRAMLVMSDERTQRTDMRLLAISRLAVDLEKAPQKTSRHYLLVCASLSSILLWKNAVEENIGQGAVDVVLACEGGPSFLRSSFLLAKRPLIVMCTYALVVGGLLKDCANVTWRGLILDDSHFLRPNRLSFFRALRLPSQNEEGGFRLCITDAPMHPTPEYLVTQVDLLDPVDWKESRRRRFFNTFSVGETTKTLSSSVLRSMFAFLDEYAF